MSNETHVTQDIDLAYLKAILEKLLLLPSPAGLTDDVVRLTCQELDKLDIPYQLTRRGAIQATIAGKNTNTEGSETEKKATRAIAAHLDTLGAMVKNLKPNGRLSVVPIGYWSARFAEGARCTIHSDNGVTYRGTVLPLKASGHTYNEAIDTQPSAWSNLEVRLDEDGSDLNAIWDLGIRVGDIISIDAQPDFNANGFINSRHIDDKAGVAAVLAAAKAIKDSHQRPQQDCHLLFTISEEIGVGACHILPEDVSEMVSVDNGTIAPEQNTCTYGVTIAMRDSTGPFDQQLTKHLIALCKQKQIEFSRDAFLYYRSDAAAAVEAGYDSRTALICFGLDASHGYERTHMRSLNCVARLLVAYILSGSAFQDHGDLTDSGGVEQQSNKRP